MQFTALETVPSLQGKSREIRLLFAETANAALAKGRTLDEATFQGLAVVKQKEQQTIKKYVKPSVPLHLQAILDLKNRSQASQNDSDALEIEKATQSSLSSAKEVVGAEFDANGRLTLKFKDGKTVISNAAPITVEKTSVIVVGDSSGTANPIITGLKTLTYSGLDLDRVDEPDGSYKLLTYVDTVLTQVDHVQSTQTVRYTLNYTGEVLTSVNTEIL